MGWDKPVFYEDDGYSAKDLRRPYLTRLLEDIKEKKYDRILTTKSDRLCRNLLDLLKLAEYFDRYECQFVSSSEGFDTSTASGRLALQILGSFAEFERERISERVRDNMISLAKTHKVITRPCFGYDVIDGHMTVNIEESLIVRKMAQWTIEGHGGREIAKRLNEMAVRSKEGNQWYDKVVRDLLRRETLIGHIIYNRTYKKGTRILTRPENEWVRMEDHHEAILDEETFRTVNDILDSRRTIGKHSSSERYLLTGLVKCAHCGSGMNGKMNRFHLKSGTERIIYQYLCDGYLKKAICTHHFIHRDDIEAHIIQKAKKIAIDIKEIKKVAQPRKESQDERNILLNRLKRLDYRIQKQIEAYEDDLITANDLKLATKRIEDTRRELEESLEQLPLKTNVTSIQTKAKKLVDVFDTDDRLKIKTAIQQLIHKIEVSNGEEISITWNL